MNYFRCKTCRNIYHDTCPRCHNCTPIVMGLLHLISTHGVDAYVRRAEMPDGPKLLIQKPSGQVWIDLAPEDLAHEDKELDALMKSVTEQAP